MPKFTVYIPDELWTEAAQADKGSNASQLVQAALRDRLVRARATAPMSAELTELFEKTAAAVEANGRREYDAGYRFGLNVAAGLAWTHLAELADSDPRTWRTYDITVAAEGVPLPDGSTVAGPIALDD